MCKRFVFTSQTHCRHICAPPAALLTIYHALNSDWRAGMTDTVARPPKEITTEPKSTDAQTRTVLSLEATDLHKANASKAVASQPKHGNDSSSATPTPAVKSLPNLILTDSKPPTPAPAPAPQDNSFFGGLERSAEGVLKVAGDIATGAVNEVVNHPGQILTDVAVGAAVGAVAITVGPEALLIGGGIALAAGAIYEVNHYGGVVPAAKAGLDEATKIAKSAWSGAVNLAQDAAIDYDPSKHSQADQAKAKAAMESVGAFGAQVGAGTLGGMGGGSLAMMAKGAISASIAAGSAAEVVSSAGVDSAAGALGASAAPAAENLANVAINGSTVESAAAAETVASASTPESTALASAEDNAVEFPTATSASDRAFIKQLGNASAALQMSEFRYGVQKLTDPSQIDQFARIQGDMYGEEALNQMRWSVWTGGVAPGTNSAWRAALAKLGDPSAILAGR
jgi:hypothetical protein